MNPKWKKYALSISYGNYATGAGGTDKYILSQQAILEKKEISLIHIYPIKSIYKFRLKKRAFWGIVVDGKDYGWLETSQIINYLHKLSEKSFELLAFIIHHLKNTGISEVKRIVDSADASIIYYLHDFMSICPGNGLLKNSVTYCGCSFPHNTKCDGCNHYNKDVLERLAQIQDFFEYFANRMEFIAPSNSTKELFTQCYPQYTDKIHVVYHQKLIGNYKKKSELNCRKIRVAYVGYQAPLKGWNEWEIATQKIQSFTNRYEFYHFGSCDTHYDYIKEIAVDFKKDNEAMIKALRQYNIDIAVLWSTWPETYSYTYYEALASNCYVLTSDYSGNIKDQVAKNRNGYIGKNNESLFDILKNVDRLTLLLEEHKWKNNNSPQTLLDSDEFLRFIPEQGCTNIRKIRNNYLGILNCYCYKFIYMIRSYLLRRRTK